MRALYAAYHTMIKSMKYHRWHIRVCEEGGEMARRKLAESFNFMSLMEILMVE
jgi:hypothetical protein